MKNEELEKIVTPELGLLGFECVKLEVLGTANNPIVRLYIDRATGVSVSDCATVSRAVGLVLERVDPFPGRYLLEVSSPGNNRPLTREEHFVRFIGEEARVTCVDAAGGKKTYTGIMHSCINGMLTMDTDSGQEIIKLADIVRANLVGREYKIDKKHKPAKKNRDKTDEHPVR